MFVQPILYHEGDIYESSSREMGEWKLRSLSTEVRVEPYVQDLGGGY